MKIAYIFGNCATSNSPEGGSYIYERLKILKQMGITISTYFIEECLSSKILKYGFRFFRGKNYVMPHVISWGIADNEYIIKDNINIFFCILNILYNKIYWKHQSGLYIKNTDVNNVDIIHSHWAFPNGYIAMNISKRLKKPYIITTHGSDIHTLPINNRIVKKYTLAALESANKVIFVSHALLEFAINKIGYSGKNAVVIPNGVDSSLFFPLTLNDALCQTGWKKTNKYVVGYVGRLVQLKRADKFVEIFLKIKEKINDVEFIIVGDGDFRPLIETECNKYGLRITFVGAIPHENVAAWMNLFDVMILPSRNEAWGCTIREAYACKVPVVASAVGGIPEAIGGLCPVIPEDNNIINKFSDAVCAVLLGTYTINKEKLFAKALEYSWTNCVNQEIKVYESISNLKLSE